MFYQEKLRNQLSDHYSQNLANLSTDIDNLDTNYILKEGELSKNIYDVKQELIDYENMKAHADNPVFTGTLVLGNSSSSNSAQKGALKVGDNWTIRSVKNSANTHINLEFVYKEGLSGETVIKFASQASYGTSHMDENPYDRMHVKSGSVTTGFYHYVYPSGVADKTQQLEITYVSDNGNDVEVTWNDVVPRGCVIAPVSDPDNLNVRATLSPYQNLPKA